MRKLMIAAAAMAFVATPVLASTLTEVVAHGIILTIGDMDIPVAYTPDGKFSAMDGAVTGTWKIDGDKMCTTSTADPSETCIAYPADKKSGDTFELTGPQGSVKIKIR
jgi:hypothetical protein